MTQPNLWPNMLEQLKLQMTQATYDTWYVDSTAVLCAGTLTITVKNAYAKDWLENRAVSLIQRTAMRVYGKKLDIAFTVEHQPPTTARDGRKLAGPPAAIGPGAATSSRPGEEEVVAADDLRLPPSARFAIELVDFDPRDAGGFTQLTNYDIWFWQPLIGPLPFALWTTLRSFPPAWNVNTTIRTEWPSIQTLADMCAATNRQMILGRAARPGHARMIGALEILEKERIVWTRKWGSGRDTLYRFNVLNKLPILTPPQVAQLTPRLQARHERKITAANVDYEQWQQLTLLTLTPEKPQ